MAAKNPIAKIGRGHAETRRDSQSGELERVEDVESYDLPTEAAFLLTVDSLQDPELKSMLKQSYWEVHSQRKELAAKVLEKNEERADKAMDAEIKLRERAQWLGFAGFVIVLICFMVALWMRVPSAALWTFSIFFAGSASVYLLGKLGGRGAPK